MFEMPAKLSTDARSLLDMSMRNPITRRATWRHRFLEIARQFEVVEGRTPRPGASGLKPRARMAGFATLRRAGGLAP